MYDLLGVSPDADTASIRDAYRRAARAHHPDRHGDASSANMAAVNEAWQVLGDPARRREYDLGLRVPAAGEPTRAGGSTTAAPYVEPAYNPLARYQDPPRFPWRFMAVLAMIGTVFVLIGVVTAPDPVPPTVDNVLQPGDCVLIEANNDAAERLCSAPHDGVVEALVPFGDTCPAAAEPHRDRQGMGTACVVLDTAAGG